LYLCIVNTNYSIYLASTRVDTTLWNHRLRHMSEKGMQIRIVFMENIRELVFLELEKKTRVKGYILCINMYGDWFRYHLLVDIFIMFLLLMMQLEKLGFI
jgi:hypothetical protein